jgi:hypothetical protein
MTKATPKPMIGRCTFAMTYPASQNTASVQAVMTMEIRDFQLGLEVLQEKLLLMAAKLRCPL